jgi:hypothetical protein
MLDSNLLKEKLIVSIGTHRSVRSLTPVEVGEGIQRLKLEGMSKKDIRELVMLEDDSMLLKFERLLSLPQEILHLIDWGQTNVAVPFSSAFELTKLNNIQDQIDLMHAIIENKFSKKEVIYIVQTKKRSKKPIIDCINDVKNLRPEIEKIYVYIGAILNENLISTLSELTQFERDKILINALNKRFVPPLDWEGRLGKRRFTLTGGIILASQIQKMTPDYETEINQLLCDEMAIINE